MIRSSTFVRAYVRTTAVRTVTEAHPHIVPYSIPALNGSVSPVSTSFRRPTP